MGPISLYLAGAARLVWGIDENGLSISAAKQNGRINGVSNCRFFTGDVVEKIKEARRTLPRIDRVVLNPTRKGVAPEALEALLSLEAPKILYVSCDPDTLARDLDRLWPGVVIGRSNCDPSTCFPRRKRWRPSRSWNRKVGGAKSTRLYQMDLFVCRVGLAVGVPSNQPLYRLCNRREASASPSRISSTAGI